ncbi:MAG: cytochrome b5 domain-containing protein [Thermodesulfobacteriota bacterium]
MKIFTEEELKKYDGSHEGQPIYFAYKGKVYDATNSPLFIDGIHFEHYAGTDLTDFMADSSHGEEVLEDLKVVGEYKPGA